MFVIQCDRMAQLSLMTLCQQLCFLQLSRLNPFRLPHK